MLAIAIFFQGCVSGQVGSCVCASHGRRLWGGSREVLKRMTHTHTHQSGFVYADSNAFVIPSLRRHKGCDTLVVGVRPRVTRSTSELGFQTVLRWSGGVVLVVGGVQVGSQVGRRVVRDTLYISPPRTPTFGDGNSTGDRGLRCVPWREVVRVCVCACVCKVSTTWHGHVLKR